MDTGRIKRALSSLDKHTRFGLGAVAVCLTSAVLASIWLKAGIALGASVLIFVVCRQWSRDFRSGD